MFAPLLCPAQLIDEKKKKKKEKLSASSIQKKVDF
jgi:hypothetical protein